MRERGESSDDLFALGRGSLSFEDLLDNLAFFNQKGANNAKH